MFGDYGGILPKVAKLLWNNDMHEDGRSCGEAVRRGPA